jgi:uncharacterized membrane protein
MNEPSADAGKEAPLPKPAIIAEGLYLLNLLFPLFPMLGLAPMYLKRRKHPEFIRLHIAQAFWAALISLALFVGANLLVLALGGYRGIQGLVVFEVYYIAIIPLFLVPGLLALIKALSGQGFRYPLLGKFVERAER